MTAWREGYSGTGPGSFTPDGCSVGFYSLLPAQREPEFIARAVPSGASILELGCGAGRVTHPLVERGHVVTAVDESAEMPARVRGAATVRSTIEGLDLPERFDAVLLGSRLVHAPDARPLLRTCVRHVNPAAPSSSSARASTGTTGTTRCPANVRCWAGWSGSPGPTRSARESGRSPLNMCCSKGPGPDLPVAAAGRSGVRGAAGVGGSDHRFVPQRRPHLGGMPPWSYVTSRSF